MLGKLLELRSLNSPWGPTSPSAPWGLWPGDPGYNAGAGTAQGALQLVTVLGCVRLICDTISTLPTDVYREAGDRKVEVDKPDWLYEPALDLTFIDWCGQVLSSLLLWGNAYCIVVRSLSTGQIIELIPVDPTIVSRVNGRYLINGRDAGEVLHIKGLMLPGSTEGLNPIAYARQTIGLGLAALRYGSEYFEGDGNMPGVIEISKFAPEDTKRNLAQQWQRKRRSGGKGLPGILDDGATWKATGVTNEDAQFLATRSFTAGEIAGQIFLVDPAELGIPIEGSTLEYKNQADRNARLARVTLMPWMIRVENAISALLGPLSYMKFNLDGLLRADLLERYQAYAIGLDNQFLVPNEPRVLEDLQPLPGGDVVIPHNPAPVGGTP